MIPRRIQPYFRMIYQKKDGDNSLFEGMLTCCNSHDFEVSVVGDIRNSIFSKIYLIPENEKIVLAIRCKKCDNAVLVFDNGCDGYEGCRNKQHIHVTTKHIKCPKCLGDDFSVVVRYDYPNIEELDELEIPEIDNAFTWIWITLECNKCGTIYKNFVDCETS